MSAYVLTPLAKGDIFRIWCYIAADSEDAANRVEQAHLRCVRVCCRICDARSYAIRSYKPYASFLDAYTLPKLRHRLQAGDEPAGDCCRYAWEEKYPAGAERAAVMDLRSAHELRSESGHW